MSKPLDYFHSSLDLDALVENQLNLQVKISYPVHHDFMIRHRINECQAILDVGTGNGAFSARLATDHPEIQFVGIDKRKLCIDRCKKITLPNFAAEQVDLFSERSAFDFSRFDGFLLRYFLLHVDHSKKILELLKTKSKRPARIWIIDLDFSQFFCVPQSSSFDKLTALVKDFCIKTSIDSRAGQRVLPILQELAYQNIVVEPIPFSAKTMTLEDFARYLKQEVLCYSQMSGKSAPAPDTVEILNFIDEQVLSGTHEVSYGMTLISANLL